MSEIRRNDPCHCGSGKKYKKCCILKDQEYQVKQDKIRKNPQLEWQSDEDWEDKDADYYHEEDIEEQYDEFEEDEGIDEEDIDEDYDDDYDEDLFKYSTDTNEEYPPLSKEDEKKVDDWWKRYKKMKQPEVIKQHLDDFLANNSLDLILNLGLEHEVLFELIGDYVKKGKADEIIPYMMEFREKYPEVYQKCAGYLDYDIIAWLIASSNNNEIEKYFSYFEQNPINYIDQLYDTHEFLMATNNAHIMIPMIKKVYKVTWFSGDIIGGRDFADIPIMEKYEHFLGQACNPEQIKNHLTELKKLKLDFSEKFLKTDFWAKRYESYHRGFEKWEEKIPQKRRQLFERVFNITENFTRYLKEEKSLSIYSANYYSEKIYNFYNQICDNNKKLKELFILTSNQIDAAVVGMSQSFMMGIDPVKALASLNALYYYAEYLFVCGNYSENEKQQLQAIIEGFSSKVFEASKDSEIEVLAFKDFPLFD